jgi:hypothetical protein
VQKTIPYILSGLLALALILLIITGNRNKGNQRQFDERITLRRQDKIPYGTWVAYQNLKGLFPQASISINRREPGYWDSLSNFEDKQTLLIITRVFQATEYDMARIISFVEAGNNVFISARYISAAADEALGCSSSSISLTFLSGMLPDSMRLKIKAPPFKKEMEFGYPGKDFSTYFNDVDTNTMEIMGVNKQGNPNFIHMRAGGGHLYVQLEPLAFSNYFLLHKENINFYENALSVIPADTKKLVWDEYFLYKTNTTREDDSESGNWLGVLMRTKNPAGQRSFGAAIWTLLLLLLVFVVMEMRRKQRYIPLVVKPRNDSLDFVKTIGRLYFDKGDHRNLSRKMSAYFTEYVRNRYKLSAGSLDDNFIIQLQFKTGIEEAELRSIVTFIKYTEDAPFITQSELAGFHRQLEAFYKHA